MAVMLGAERLRNLIPRLGRLWIILPQVATCLALAGLAHQQKILRDPVVVAALSLFAMPVELGLAVRLTKFAPRLAVPLQVIECYTLAVYVLHTITLRLLLAYVPALGGVAGIAWLLGLTVTATALAIGMGTVLEIIPGLFGLPQIRRYAHYLGAKKQMPKVA